MAVFDSTKIKQGDSARISFPGSQARNITGVVAFVNNTHASVEYVAVGSLRQVLSVSADEVLNGAVILTTQNYSGSELVIDTGGGVLPPIPFNVFNKEFSNATFNGECNMLSVDLRPNLSLISFWGFAIQNAAGTPGQSFKILDVAEYPIFERFVGQVDQFAIGYNAATNDFKYVPIRITNQGMEIVTAPNISVGTRFSYQFVLFLADTNEG